MSRQHHQVAVPALALRRSEAAAALGVSVEHFDQHVRPFVPATRMGSITVYTVAGLAHWLEHNSHVLTDELAA